MPATLPTTPHAPRAVRLAAIAIGLGAAILATRTTLTSTDWVGRVFPGFLLLDNQLVASVGLADWSGSAVPGLYQSQVVAVDGQAVGSTADVYARVAARPAGAAVRYRLRRAGEEREVTIASARFSARDWCFVFGAFLVNGAATLAAGLVPWVIRPRAALARALLLAGTVAAVFLFTAMDLYGPATLFRVHVAAEALLPGVLWHLGLLFPHPHPLARWRFAGYAVSLAILVAYERLVYDPALYARILYLNMSTLTLGALFFGARLVSEYRRGRSPLARQRVRIVTLGTLFGFGLPGALLLASFVVAGGIGLNLAALTPSLLALSLAYAVVKQDLFEVDEMVKRAAYYLLLTGAVGTAYVGAVVVFNLILQAGAVTDSPAFPVLFTLTVLLLFNPLRTRLQAFVDRVFFRTRYDGAQVLAAVGGELGATLQRDRIVALVRECVDAAIPNAGTRLFVVSLEDHRPREIGRTAPVPPAVVARLTEGRVLTTFDSPELYPDLPTHEAVRSGLAALGAEIAVPLQLRDELVGVLTAGPKRSGLFYTAADAEFLRALAHQAAIALENARTYEALVELNARLEERVRERTSQLEGANRELAEAYAELKNAEVQLVQSEKMASLGRLVAGVAHEINNPVSFIATSVIPLKRRLEAATTDAPPEVAKLLHEAEEIVGIMARGAERTAAIVKDLRSFSRLGEATRKLVDLHEGLEASLRLLESRWRDRITVHRDYGALPLVECDSGQVNQVFLNVLNNACDAIGGGGNLWVMTRADGGVVTVTIRDDGVGMAPDVIRRIFDPFFTTKDVGSGTGLGLAISHSVVAAHGGRIEVESAPGAGATFRVILPVTTTAVSLDRAASGSR